MAFTSSGILFVLALSLVRAKAHCEGTSGWSGSTTFTDHVDFSFLCLPERLKLSFSGGRLEGEAFLFQRLPNGKYEISTKNSLYVYRLIVRRSSNWTLTLSSTKGVQLIDTAQKMTLPISLSKGQVGVCYRVRFEANRNIDLRFSHKGSAPCRVSPITATGETTTTTEATTTTTTTEATTATTEAEDLPPPRINTAVDQDQTPPASMATRRSSLTSLSSPGPGASQEAGLPGARAKGSQSSPAVHVALVILIAGLFVLV
ncbi:uncharacterized protein LOC122262855 isoform X2 [Penaeus japonicus]|uniref:uncharacterized protein LOC122262855 isoform X2 n=1 Tax=Penaeus japonicus TaxID=27405 RepID=UPI001C70FDF7|nr:uncharacterized protein LOC122262855 isoform X2 [Penaeus japonicus]